MAARSHERGHPIEFRDGKWVYSDTGEEADGKRECIRCGRKPLPDGEDMCLGHLDGVTDACCGHGVEEEYIVGCSDEEFRKAMTECFKKYDELFKRLAE